MRLAHVVMFLSVLGVSSCSHGDWLQKGIYWFIRNHGLSLVYCSLSVPVFCFYFMA